MHRMNDSGRSDRSDENDAPDRGWIATLIIRLGTFLMSRVILPLLKVASVVLVVIILSFVIYNSIERSLVPNALIHQSLYFDYIASSPVANVSLVAKEDQWINYKPVENAKEKRFLKSGNRYNIDVLLNVAKSANNFEIGKFPITLRIIDSRGEPIAKSIRSVSIPYQSPTSLFLESIFKFPLRLTGCLKPGESIDIGIPMMRDYIEPHLSYPPATLLEISLPNSEVYLQDAHITLLPTVTGLSYYMYYHPTQTLLVGVTAIAIFQLNLYGAIYLILYSWRYIQKSAREAEEEEEEEEDEERKEDKEKESSGVCDVSTPPPPLHSVDEDEEEEEEKKSRSSVGRDSATSLSRASSRNKPATTTLRSRYSLPFTGTSAITTSSSSPRNSSTVRPFDRGASSRFSSSDNNNVDSSNNNIDFEESNANKIEQTMLRYRMMQQQRENPSDRNRVMRSNSLETGADRSNIDRPRSTSEIDRFRQFRNSGGNNNSNFIVGNNNNEPAQQFDQELEENALDRSTDILSLIRKNKKKSQ